MESHSAYTRRNLRNAVNLSAVLGWLLVSTSIIGEGGFRFILEPGLWIIAAILGLPIAFLACWLIVAPILKRVMRRPIS